MKPLLRLRVLDGPDTGTKALGTSFGRLSTAPAGLERDYAFESEARLDCRPEQGGRAEPWWLLARTPEDVAGYYRFWIERRFGVRLIQPGHGAHITVVAGERPLSNEGAWAGLHGRVVSFRYAHEVFTNGRHWWIRARSAKLEAIRASFGFPRRERGRRTGPSFP